MSLNHKALSSLVWPFNNMIKSIQTSKCTVKHEFALFPYTSATPTEEEVFV